MNTIVFFNDTSSYLNIVPEDINRSFNYYDLRHGTFHSHNKLYIRYIEEIIEEDFLIVYTFAATPEEVKLQHPELFI